MNVKQYRNLIKAFFNSHRQINTVKSGNQFNFNADSKITYPVAHIEYLGANTTGGRGYNFLVTIADLFDPNLEESEEDIYSDSTSIANDTIDWFSNQNQLDYTINEGVQINNFNNGHTDKVCGATFLLSFSEFRTVDTCVIPLKP